MNIQDSNEFDNVADDQITGDQHNNDHDDSGAPGYCEHCTEKLIRALEMSQLRFFSDMDYAEALYAKTCRSAFDAGFTYEEQIEATECEAAAVRTGMRKKARHDQLSTWMQIFAEFQYSDIDPNVTAHSLLYRESDQREHDHDEDRGIGDACETD